MERKYSKFGVSNVKLRIPYILEICYDDKAKKHLYKLCFCEVSIIWVFIFPIGETKLNNGYNIYLFNHLVAVIPFDAKSYFYSFMFLYVTQ